MMFLVSHHPGDDLAWGERVCSHGCCVGVCTTGDSTPEDDSGFLY